jgi:hypothetical protein
MSDAKQIQFGQRLRRIDRHHRKLARGYVTSVNHDGLIVARPRRQTSLFPLRGLFLCLLTLLAFKGFLFAQLGPTAYAERVAMLQSGTVVEKMGAYAMKADPVTLWISGQIRPFIH